MGDSGVVVRGHTGSFNHLCDDEPRRLIRPRLPAGSSNLPAVWAGTVPLRNVVVGIDRSEAERRRARGTRTLGPCLLLKNFTKFFRFFVTSNL